MKAKPMKVTGVVTPTGFVLTVEHERWQSYSRAVEPRAMREAPLFALFHKPTTTCTLVSVDHDGPAPEGRAVSVYAFVTS